MLAVNGGNGMQFKKWTWFQKVGMVWLAPTRAQLTLLWFDETFLDISLPGLVVSHAALRLFAGEF